MSASTQGTPAWLMRMEQANAQLKRENYITWLLTRGKEHDIPDEVIAAQLERNGYVVTSDANISNDTNIGAVTIDIAVSEDVEVKPTKMGRPAKTKKE